jgi:hypothetical protein
VVVGANAPEITRKAKLLNESVGGASKAAQAAEVYGQEHGHGHGHGHGHAHDEHGQCVDLNTRYIDILLHYL